MNFSFKIIAFLFFIEYYNPTIAEKSDSINTIISMEFSRFNSYSNFDIPNLSKSSNTQELTWQNVGFRIHQELNNVFQINTGFIIQSVSTGQLPDFTHLSLELAQRSTDLL